MLTIGSLLPSRTRMTTHAGFLDRITVDPDVCDGKAVIKGTQVSVSLLLAAITDGDSIVEVASCYGVTEDDVRAAVAYASEAVRAH
jgi:uncharacterized protein (DUF433 family)